MAAVLEYIRISDYCSDFTLRCICMTVTIDEDKREKTGKNEQMILYTVIVRSMYSYMEVVWSMYALRVFFMNMRIKMKIWKQ